MKFADIEDSSSSLMVVGVVSSACTVFSNLKKCEGLCPKDSAGAPIEMTNKNKLPSFG